MSKLPEYLCNGELLSGWTVEDLLGEGGHGKVFRISKHTDGSTQYAALKWVSIAKSRFKALYPELSEAHLTERMRLTEIAVLKETEIMRRLVGYENIVQYQAHEVLMCDGDSGVDILIRMELLNKIAPSLMSVHDVVRLACDVCTALASCERIGVRHGDIKPENILMDGKRTFKLGDFSIAENILDGTSGTRAKGTYRYIAPEVFHGGMGDSRSDLYALGLVMYWLLNGGRLPYLPYAPTPYSAKDEEDAIYMRLSGTAPAQLPSPPERADTSLFIIIQRACAFSADQRYQCAQQMLDALNALTVDESLGNASLGDIEPSSTSTPIPFDDVISSTKTPEIMGTVASKETPITSVPDSALVNAGLPPIIESDPIPESRLERGMPDKPLSVRSRRINWRNVLIGLGCIVCVALIVVIGLVIKDKMLGMSELKLVSASASHIQLCWDDNGRGPWTVQYQTNAANAFDLAESATTQAEIELTGLVPGTSYNIEVRNSYGSNAMISVDTNPSIPGQNKEHRLIGMDVYRYFRLDLEYRSLRTMVESGNLPAVNEGNLALRDVAPAMQSEGLVLSLACTLLKSGQARQTSLLVVLRLKDGRVLSTRQDIALPANQSYWGAYFDLDLLLDPLWQRDQRWPDEGAVIEAYVDDEFVGSIDVAFH